MMASEFEMSMIGELSYFLGLQIKQMKNGTFVSQGKYIKDMLKKFGMDDAKAISTPMGTSGSLDSDASGNMLAQYLGHCTGRWAVSGRGVPDASGRQKSVLGAYWKRPNTGV